MSPEHKVLEGIIDLIAELEAILENVEDHGLIDHAREELQGQSGTVNSILEAWDE